MSEEQLLWECQDQMNPDYFVKVVRTSPYKGQLSLSFQGNIFYTTEVDVHFDAQFGADFMDIEEWAHIACAVTQRDEEKRAGKHN